MNLNIVRTVGLAAGAVVMAVAFSHPLVAADITGKWSFTWNTDESVVNTVMEVLQDGDTLSATMDDAKLTGTVTGDIFRTTGEYYSAEAGYEATLKVAGKQIGKGLAGNATWDEIPITFKAVRSE